MKSKIKNIKKTLIFLSFALTVISSLLASIQPVNCYSRTIVVQVSSSSDDCNYKPELGEEYFWLTVETSYAGHGGVRATEYGAMRFVNVQIPKGALITHAVLHLYCFDMHGTSRGEVVRTKITGEDTDDARIFSTAADYEARNRTSAFVRWDNIPPWDNDVWYESPDISSIIQEIVNRAGWQSGNAIVIFWEDDGSDRYAERAYQQWDWAYGDHQYAPKLEVTFTPPPNYIINVPNVGTLTNP